MYAVPIGPFVSVVCSSEMKLKNEDLLHLHKVGNIEVYNQIQIHIMADRLDSFPPDRKQTWLSANHVRKLKSYYYWLFLKNNINEFIKHYFPNNVKLKLRDRPCHHDSSSEL